MCRYTSSSELGTGIEGILAAFSVAWLGSGILCVEDQALAVWNGFPRQFMRDAATQTHRDHGKWLRACTLYVYCLCFIFVFIAVMKFFHLFLQGFDSVGSREGEKSLTLAVSSEDRWEPSLT